MKIKKSELLEHIRKLNKEQPLKESADIQRVLWPADADAQEQHEKALAANKERLDPENYTEEVKEAVELTASEESRYAHFDVVDRKDLAKRINDAREKGLEFKVTRSIKEGYRYDLAVLKEEFLKKDVGDPAIGVEKFNKATDIGAAPVAPVCEDVEEKKLTTVRIHPTIAADDLVDIEDGITVSELIDFLNENVDGESKIAICCDEGCVGLTLDNISLDEEEAEEDAKELEDVDIEDDIEDVDELDDSQLDASIEDDKEALHEELKVYTSTLDDFEPSAKSKALWDKIKEAGKVKDLEYNLEVIYPDGISDIALDAFLSDEPEWICDLLDLNIDEIDTDAEAADDVQVEDSVDDAEELADLDNDSDEYEIIDDEEEPLEDESEEVKSDEAAEGTEEKSEDDDEIVDIDDDEVDDLLGIKHSAE